MIRRVIARTRVDGLEISSKRDIGQKSVREMTIETVCASRVVQRDWHKLVFELGQNHAVTDHQA